MNTQQIMTAGGGILILFGLFCPFAFVPVVGSISGINVLNWVALLPLVLAGVALYAVITYQDMLHMLSAGALLLLLVIQIVSVQMNLSGARAELTQGSGLESLAGAVMTSAGVSWGAGVLVVGAVLILGSRWIED